MIKCRRVVKSTHRDRDKNKAKERNNEMNDTQGLNMMHLPPLPVKEVSHLKSSPLYLFA